MNTTSGLAHSFAAIDLGSNSFHMVIAEPEGNSIRTIDSLRIPVRLGAGLDKQKRLKPDTMDRALDALGQFAERLRGVPLKQVRVVGTNTLRRAKNADKFLHEAHAILGKRIAIISGREEARLIFTGVSHAIPDPDTQRLVIDIGGGSTEFIIGKGFNPELLESVHLGCVSYTNKFIDNKNVTARDIKKASIAAQLELTPIVRAYTELGWSEATGCSGTIKAVANILAELNLTDGEIRFDALKQLIQAIDKAGTVEKLNLQSISSDRSAVICGGIAVLHAIFKTFKINSLQASQVALREGLIFDMVGQTQHVDIQTQTLANMFNRYDIDTVQATRVEDCATHFFNQVKDSWNLDSESDLSLLCWAAKLHEMGKAVAHTQYHKHGAYLIQNSEFIGFTMAEQNALALLVRFHRRKIDFSAFENLEKSEKNRLLRLTSLLRLAALFHRGRHSTDLSAIKLKARDNQLTVIASQDFLDENPLTSAELSDEASRMLHVEIKLKTN
jgi:exopolyphosphatase/guanosine-5'-triphosphate,3'-diphosphate pyrophosphatase